MVTCRETVGDCGRSLSQTPYFSEDRRCSRLPTDTTVKSAPLAFNRNFSYIGHTESLKRTP